METSGVTIRPFAGHDDFWPLRGFLTELYSIAPPGQVWDVRRWDGAYFYASAPGLEPGRAARTRIWQTSGGRIVAALLSEGGRGLHPHVHPELRHIEGDVIAAGERLAADLGDTTALVTCFQHDLARRRLLESRGYEPTESWGVLRRLRFDSGPLPEAAIAEAYQVRTTRPLAEDHQRLADLLNAAFGRDIHHAGETLGFQSHAPSFRRELDLVAQAADGVFAAYAAVCWDDHNKHAIFEPVCTHPDHRQRGLAKALMREGLRRARDLGARFASVETGDLDPANALYDSMDFGEAYHAVCWSKAL